MAKKSDQYVVLHDAVDRWRKGSVITEGDVAEGDVPRLLRLHAIRPATAEDVQAAEEHPVDSTDLQTAMLGPRPTLEPAPAPATEEPGK